MALPLLFNGGMDCGPSNPLQNLAKRYDSDRPVGRLNPVARDTLDLTPQYFSSRTLTHDHSIRADALQFFTSLKPQAPIPQLPLVQNLPPVSTHPSALSRNWASEFLTSQPINQAGPSTIAGDFAQRTVSPPFQLSPQSASFAIPGPSSHLLRSAVPFSPAGTQWQHTHMTSSADAESITAAIDALQLDTSATSQTDTTHHDSYEGDEFAKTAGLLVESVKLEANPKFQNSTFLQLMRQIRDGEVVVDGDTLKECLPQAATSTDVKGKGKAKELQPMLVQPIRKTVHFDTASTILEDSSPFPETESEIDQYLRRENQEYTEIWREHDDLRFASRLPGAIAPDFRQPTAEEAEWGALQADWDRFEAVSSGIRPVTQYTFVQNNPLMEASHHHSYHSYALQDAILLKEAEVQRDIRNAQRWFELGVKQQENEREDKAIQALTRAVELDPTFLDAWLALSISFSNEGRRTEAYEAIEKWVSHNEQYSAVVEGSKNLPGVDKKDELIDTLVAMIRSVPDSKVDADTQVALAVVLHTSEDYAKAHDCFRAALEARPQDWLLYNRVGATLANSGNADDALQYYYKALELNPSYIRARFNLSISCSSLKRYEEAAQHVLDALVLQSEPQAEISSNAEFGKGVAPSALWDALRSSLIHLHRIDLATLCDERDIDRIRAALAEALG